MIQLNYHFLNEPFILLPNKLNILSIENPKEFFNAINSFYKKTDVTIYNKDNVISLENDCDVLLSPFLIDYNSKKIQNMLMKKLETSFAASEYFSQFNTLNAYMQNFINLVTESINLPITFNDKVSVIDIFKIANINIAATNEDNILPKLIDYINVVSQLKSLRLLVFINIKQYLSKNDCYELLKHFEYNEITPLFVESKLSSFIYEFENVLIIDDDLCDFVAN